MIWYWRFTHREHGEICGPCAWVLAYQGQWRSIAVHESSKLMIACHRCERTMWTVASHTLPVVAA